MQQQVRSQVGLVSSCDLAVQREVVELEVFHEQASDASSFEDEGFSFRVAVRSQPRRFLRLAQNVLDVQKRVPKLVQI